MTLKRGKVQTYGPDKLTRLGPYVLNQVDREDVFPLLVTRARYLAFGDDALPVRCRRPNRLSSDDGIQTR